MPDYNDITDVPEVPLEKGYYYHYKHDPKVSFNNYAYQVLGTLRHTENNTLLMVYRPLYENTYLDVDLSGRPLEMALETTIVNGFEVRRFTRIEDAELIARLQEIQSQMYID